MGGAYWCKPKGDVLIGWKKSQMTNYLLFFFLGPHLQHIEVPGLGVESELQLLARTNCLLIVWVVVAIVV